MKRITITAGAVCLLLAGCSSTGLSIREVGKYNYAQFVYSLYDGQKERPAEHKTVRKPIKLAIAQIGEAAAPEAMIERFRQEGYLIAQVQSLPASMVEADAYRRAEEKDSKGVTESVQNMLYLARDLDADYLFIFGGTVSYGSTPNFLQVLDLSIIGAYIFPSLHHTAEGRASGALVDVRDGRPLFMVSAESRMQRTTPSYMNYYEKNERLITDMRDDLVGKLSEDFLKRLADL